MSSRRISLKVDVDTLRGTLEGCIFKSIAYPKQGHDPVAGEVFDGSAQFSYGSSHQFIDGWIRL